MARPLLRVVGDEIRRRLGDAGYTTHVGYPVGCMVIRVMLADNEATWIASIILSEELVRVRSIDEERHETVNLAYEDAALFDLVLAAIAAIDDDLVD
jgi:hypothetical protein